MMQSALKVLDASVAEVTAAAGERVAGTTLLLQLGAVTLLQVRRGAPERTGSAYVRTDMGTARGAFIRTLQEASASIPQFLSPYLGNIITLVLQPPLAIAGELARQAAGAHATASSSYQTHANQIAKRASAVRLLIASRVPPRVLLPALVAAYAALTADTGAKFHEVRGRVAMRVAEPHRRKTDSARRTVIAVRAYPPWQASLVSFFQMVAAVIRRLTRPEVVTYHGDLAAFFQTAFDLRNLPVSQAVPLGVRRTQTGRERPRKEPPWLTRRSTRARLAGTSHCRPFPRRRTACLWRSRTW